MANQADSVDRGSLRAIFDGTSTVAQPVLQCLQVKPIAGPQDQPDRYRVVFSDINNFVQCMLAIQANHVVANESLRKGCFARLKEFQANMVKGRRILIVLGLEVIEELGECEKIGTPEPLEIKEEETKETKPTTISSNGFYGNRPEQPAQQQLPSRSHGGASSASHGNIYPIEGLSPYAHKWTIKARVTSKSEIKTWHNRNGEGKLFSVNLLDESGEIKATGFKDQCDAFYELFQEGCVYYISSPCRVQLAKKQFTNLNNDYELTFEQNTIIEKAEEQDDVPQVRFNFTSIGDMSGVEKDAVVDTIGVLIDVSETQQITSKTTSRPYDKRELTLADNTQYKIRLTIWGNTATNFDQPLDTVIAFKGAKVSDFGGKSLSLLSSGTITVNPDIEEAYKLKGWYDAQGRNTEFSNHQYAGAGVGAATGQRNDLKTITQVKDEQLGMSEAPDYFSVKATIIYILQKSSLYYAACLSENCNKKVVEEDGGWRCEKCDKTHPKPQYRYIMQVNVADHTGQLYLSCFDDTGNQVMGMSADKLVELEEEDKQVAQNAIQDATNQTYVFRCRAKMDTYQDTPRVRYQVVGATPVNYSQESAKLIELIKLYEN